MYETRKNGHIYAYIALASKVLVVASVNTDAGDWTVYIDAVPGKNHDDEWEEVARNGTKVPQLIGEYCFPRYKDEYNWRP